MTSLFLRELTAFETLLFHPSTIIAAENPLPVDVSRHESIVQPFLNNELKSSPISPRPGPKATRAKRFIPSPSFMGKTSWRLQGDFLGGLWFEAFVKDANPRQLFDSSPQRVVLAVTFVTSRWAKPLYTINFIEEGMLPGSLMLCFSGAWGRGAVYLFSFFFSFLSRIIWAMFLS
jgi:hypothetical protein